MARSESPSVSVSRRGSAGGDANYTVVWVRGEVDAATRMTLVDSVARAAELDGMTLLVDLSEVTFMDASIVGAIVESRNRLASRGQLLEVRAPSPRALRLLDLCGLAHLVHGAPLPSAGAAPALSTWIDVRPIQPAGAVDLEAARREASEPARVLATAEVLKEESAKAIEVDLRGT